MNEYIKYFDNLDQAEGYEIREVPFSGYVQEPHLALFSKRWGDIKEGKVSYDRYLFYTTNDGSTVGLNNSSEFPELLENVYLGAGGVMEFSDSITNIGYCAFNDCSSLTSITIPQSVTSIGEVAFQYCKSLTSVTIPNSVTSIGLAAFHGCTSLTTITCEATTPPTLGSANGLSNITAVYVPAESVDAYKNATNWAYYSNVIQSIQ